jgi:hypothetical protein
MSSLRCVLLLGFLCACTDAGIVGRFCPMGTCVEPGVEPDAQRDAAMVADDICADGGVELQRDRLDLYLLVDDSASMVLWWQDTISAINAFITDPNSAGIGVGLQFFGIACDAASYAQPRVPIAPLPDNTAALMAAFPILPTEETATLPAMQGAVTYAKSWATQHPERRTAVLLLTDGLPEECGSTVDNVAQVAREANQSSPSIPTYVIVIGAIGALNVFASAGGTGDAKLVAPGSAIELQQALDGVRLAARGCTFRLPGDPTDSRVQLNVVREHSDGARATLPAVADAASCDVQRGGWYYADATAPSTIVLCPASCNGLGTDRLQATSNCPSRPRGN